MAARFGDGVDGAGPGRRVHRWRRTERDRTRGSARADPGPRNEARGLFDAGAAAFDAGRYEDALGYFERSYEISHLPELLYNIGHTAERLRRDERALEAFEEYLRLRPDGNQAPAVRARIENLRQVIAEQQARDAALRDAEARATQATEPEPESGGGGLGGWIVLGVGVAVAGVGAGLLGYAASRAAEVQDAPEGTPWPMVRDAHADADTFAIVGAVGLGVGVVAMAIGAIWGIVELGSETEVAIGPGGATVRGRF